MKQKTINPISFGMNDKTKRHIKCIVNQLDNNGYAIMTDSSSVSQFINNIPLFYRKNNIILISRTKKLKNEKTKTIITIKPEYKLVRNDAFSFKLEMKI